MAVWRGGAKHKAPYDSTHVRVPVPLKPKVEALINEFRASIDGFNKGETKPSESSLTSLEDEKDEEDEEDGTEPSDSETIKSQAETIQAYASEIHFLKHKLDQSSSLTSLEDAKKLANTCLTSKKGKWREVARLLSGIYQVEVTSDDLEVN
jgi:predicted RNase H-like nuclease (RuvC/YqgF family)